MLIFGNLTDILAISHNGIQQVTSGITSASTSRSTSQITSGISSLTTSTSTSQVSSAISSASTSTSSSLISSVITSQTTPVSSVITSQTTPITSGITSHTTSSVSSVITSQTTSVSSMITSQTSPVTSGITSQTTPVSSAITSQTTPITSGITSHTASSVSSMITSQTRPRAAWTFMVYMDGDNGLESFLTYDFAQFMAVGSTPQVNVIVLSAKYSTNSAAIYYVQKDAANKQVDWGSTDMGNPETLRRFIVYSALNYPAYHYVLILQDHGSGLDGVIFDDTSTPHDYLTMNRLKTALREGGVHFDIIGFDACLMGMAEVAYQIKDFSDYMVASEEDSIYLSPGAWGPGGSIWHYDLILADLVKNPLMLGRELAQIIVTHYGENIDNAPGITISAIDLAHMDELASAVRIFGQSLKNGLPAYGAQIRKARERSDHYNVSSYVDLGDFANLTLQDGSIADTNIKSASVNIINLIDNQVVIALQCRTDHPRCHGLSIYFDTSRQSYNGRKAYYLGLDFAVTGWNAFIEAYLSSYGTLAISGSIIGLSQTKQQSYPNSAGQITEYVWRWKL